MNVRAWRGQSAIEFQIIAVLVLFPLLMGLVQMGLLVVSTYTLNAAAMAAARAGAASGGDKAAMQSALDIGLAPLQASATKAFPGLGMTDISGGIGGNDTTVTGDALLVSKGLNGQFSEMTVLNPTDASFNDFGVKTRLGTVIPVTDVHDSGAVGNQSRQTRADSLQLKIEVKYCEELVIPIINDIMRAFLAPGGSKQANACYLAGRVQLTSQAVVRMTVAPIREKLL